jgi:2-iminobutanoate/2-iminopropanoate deaminase
VKKIIDTSGAPKALGPYSQAVMWGDTLYLSGQVGIDPGEGRIVEGEEAV